MAEYWAKLDECKGWVISSRGMVKKREGSIKTAKIPIEKGRHRFYYSFMKGSQKKYIKVAELVNKYFPNVMLTALQIKVLRDEVVKHRPPSAFKTNIKSLQHKSNIRRCATCGRPTTQYRCESCWAKIRNDPGLIGFSEESYHVMRPGDWG